MYGTGARRGEIVAATAVGYPTGRLPVPVRGALSRDPHGKVDPQTLLGTDLNVAPEQILAGFVQRWQREVTCEQARRHHGGDTPRQGSALAIRRTLPALRGRFSLVPRFTQPSVSRRAVRVRQAAWYHKAQPTFADALALVRRELWTYQTFRLSADASDTMKISRALLQHLMDTLCYAA